MKVELSYYNKKFIYFLHYKIMRWIKKNVRTYRPRMISERSGNTRIVYFYLTKRVHYNS